MLRLSFFRARRLAKIAGGAAKGVSIEEERAGSLCPAGRPLIGLNCGCARASPRRALLLFPRRFVDARGGVAAGRRCNSLEWIAFDSVGRAACGKPWQFVPAEGVAGAGDRVGIFLRSVRDEVRWKIGGRERKERSFIRPVELLRYFCRIVDDVRVTHG